MDGGRGLGRGNTGSTVEEMDTLVKGVGLERVERVALSLIVL